jgi:hypothetical protein
MEGSKMKQIVIKFIVAITVFLLAGCSSGIGPSSVKKLKESVKNDDIMSVFKLVSSYSHDKSKTQIEIDREFESFKKSWKDSNLRVYLKPEGEFSEIKENCNKDRSDCKLTTTFTYDNPEMSVVRRSSKKPFIRRVKSAKIVFRQKKAQGNTEFTHLYLYDFDPLEYFSKYDNQQYEKKYSQESKLSSSTLKKYVKVGDTNSQTHYGSNTYSGYWSHYDDISRYVPSKSESYVSGSSIKFKVHNTLSVTPIKVKLKISFKTEFLDTQRCDCNDVVYESESFVKYYTVIIAPQRSKKIDKYYNTEVTGEHGGCGLCIRFGGASFERVIPIDSSTITIDIASVTPM